MIRQVVWWGAGAVLLGALAGWAILATPSAPDSDRTASGVGLLALGLALGALTAALWSPLPALAVMGGVAAAFVATAPDSTSGRPLAPPLDYENANGEVLLIAAAAAVVVVARRGWPWRVVVAIGAGGVAVFSWSLGAQASALATGLLAGWCLLALFGHRAWWRVAGTALVAAPAGFTLAWAAGTDPPARVVSGLTPERIDLWREAWGLMSDNPVAGVGPGRFRELSPTASGDTDLAWAHSYVLQTGAELGLVGLALLGAVLAWLLLLLGRLAPLLGILLLPASVDYVLDFGWVLLASGVVLGAALVSGSGKPGLTPPAP